MTTTVYAPIVLDDDGVAYIAGTTAKVTEVVLPRIVDGLTADEVQAELPHLSLSQVYAAFSYYYAHEQELDEQIAGGRATVARIRSETPPSRIRRRMHGA